MSDSLPQREESGGQCNSVLSRHPPDLPLQYVALRLHCIYKTRYRTFSLCTDAMLFLLLIHSVLVRAQSGPAVNEGGISPSCDNTNDDRTLWDIIWSCLTTIFLCTWVALHPNLPAPIDPREQSSLKKCHHMLSCLFKNRLPLFLCAVFFPEYILGWAMRQSLNARKIIKREANLELTMAHGFLIIMGGFHYFEILDQTRIPDESTKTPSEDPQPGELTCSDAMQRAAIPRHPLIHECILSMVKEGKINMPTEGEINDRSKSDWLAKMFALIQTIWFVSQCIARHAENLHITELEIVTLAYTVINLGIFIAWWHKPLNMDCPIRVFQQPPELDRSRITILRFQLWYVTILGIKDQHARLHSGKKVPTFYAGNPGEREILLADTITLVTGATFGAVHCIAWSFGFSSHYQVLLWRVSSIVITFFPIFFVGVLGAALLPQEGYNRDKLETVTGILTPLVLFLYFIARIATLSIAFIRLSSLPPSAFQAVHWTTFIPHV